MNVTGQKGTENLFKRKERNWRCLQYIEIKRTNKNHGKRNASDDKQRQNQAGKKRKKDKKSKKKKIIINSIVLIFFLLFLHNTLTLTNKVAHAIILYMREKLNLMLCDENINCN